MGRLDGAVRDQIGIEACELRHIDAPCGRSIAGCGLRKNHGSEEQCGCEGGAGFGFHGRNFRDGPWQPPTPYVPELSPV